MDPHVISLVTVPDEVRDSGGSLTAAVVAQGERRKDRLAILNARGNHEARSRLPGEPLEVVDDAHTPGSQGSARVGLRLPF